MLSVCHSHVGNAYVLTDSLLKPARSSTLEKRHRLGSYYQEYVFCHVSFVFYQTVVAAEVPVSLGLRVDGDLPGQGLQDGG